MAEKKNEESVHINNTKEKNDYQTLSPTRKPQLHPNAIPDLHEVSLVTPTKKKKEPRRVIHFSDGVVEEYSTDEEEEERKKEEAKKKADEEKKRALVNPKELRWIPWMLHYSWKGGSKFIAVCDFVGEKIAWWVGITSPKYYYEIEEFKRIKAEEEERKKKEDIETRGWRETNVDKTIELDPASLPK